MAVGAARASKGKQDGASGDTAGASTSKSTDRNSKATTKRQRPPPSASPEPEAAPKKRTSWVPKALQPVDSSAGPSRSSRTTSKVKQDTTQKKTATESKPSPKPQAAPKVAAASKRAPPRDRGQTKSTPNGTSSKLTATPERRDRPARAEAATPPAKSNGHAVRPSSSRTTPRTDTTNPSPAPSIRSSKRVAESLQAASGARKRPRVSDLPSFDDDVFGTPTAVISTAAFRANESLRKQREARNFTFDGDANSPRQTRSGRVAVLKEDEYGAGMESGSEVEASVEPEERVEDIDDGDDDEELRVITGFDVPVEPVSRLSDKLTLPASARPLVLGMLGTLTGRNHASIGEESEALQGLVSLLNGTVERGEGNSALLTGPRGAGKSMTVEKALLQLPSGSTNQPIVVRLSGHAQTDDRRAIREMGRQIALAEGRAVTDEEEDVDVDDRAPTTLPSHLLALLTQPSPRAIIVVIDEFDLFTEHARQALLYCLLDVVQSVQTGPVETTPRGIAVIGMTCRVDTLLLLEKRVKSRFSHRVWRVLSPLSTGGVGWKALIHRALIPWDKEEGEAQKWMADWAFGIEMVLNHDKISSALERLSELTTDVRLLYRPFIAPITAVLSKQLEFISVPALAASIRTQLDLAGWSTGIPPGGSTNPSTAIQGKLRGLPHPTLGVLIIAKHLSYAGRDEFSFAQVEDEYLRFARLRLVGSGRQRWPLELLRQGFEHARALGLVAPAAPAGRAGVGRFAKVRSGISPQDVVAFFRAEGGRDLGPELAGWGRMAGAHA